MNKVLVTGADGFIGSHLVEELLAQGVQVRALSYYNSFNDWGWLESIAPGKLLEVVSGDVRDPFFCDTLIKGIDTVFHLAALIAIPYSYVAPQSYVETNITGTLNLCQAALKAGVAKFIQTSTSEVYGTARYAPIDEKHPLQPQSPYSASKIGADQMALSYHYSFGLPVVVARPFNTFGPRQSARAVIPTIITQLLSGRKQIRLGSTSPVRDFNYVQDTVSGFLAIARSDKGMGEVFNIGSGVGVTIGETFDLLKSITQSDAIVIEDDVRIRPAGSEVHKLICDTSKFRLATGYSQRFDLRKGLEATVEWFRVPGNLKKYKVDLYNV